MFRVLPPPIIRSANNCIYSIWYLSHRYWYLPLSRQVAITVWQIPDAVNTVVCAPDDGWWYHPKHVEQFPDINKLCNVASCWIYIGIYLRWTAPLTLNTTTSLPTLEDEAIASSVNVLISSSRDWASCDSEKKYAATLLRKPQTLKKKLK